MKECDKSPDGKHKFGFWSQIDYNTHTESCVYCEEVKKINKEYKL